MTITTKQQDQEEAEQPHTDDQIDAALYLTRGFDADTFCQALDILGWKIVPQDPDQPSRWPLAFHYENPPAWIENGDKLPTRMTAEADAAEEAVWGYDVAINGPRAAVERNQCIGQLYAAGLTLQQIGDRFGITGQRVWQIVNREGTR